MRSAVSTRNTVVVTRAMRVGALALALAAPGCVESRDVPALIPQARIDFGDRLHLMDETREAEPTLGRCTRFGLASTSTSAAEVVGVDGKGAAIDASVPHNCFLPVQPGQLQVDQLEATNELFQLCVDSGACDAPDPSESNKSQVCSDEARFDTCPVVEVSQQSAVQFCNWIGRRLPTAYEHLMMRQAHFDPADLATFTPFLDGTEPPETCEDAVTRAPGCVASKPRPSRVAQGGVEGAARLDTVEGDDGARVFDLAGNVSEWAADLFPVRRGTADGLPWFCLAPLPAIAAGPLGPDNLPLCPPDRICAWGQYRPAPGMAIGVHPVCVASVVPDEAPVSGVFSGTTGTLFGGSHRDADPTRVRLGAFGRRTEPDPQGLPDTARAREYGIRCVGDRGSAMDGVVPAFTDGVFLDRTFSR
jgi:hypothetical protein